MRHSISSFLLVSWSAGIALSAAGCAEKDRLVHENYAQIRAHASTMDDVEAALGPPTNKLDDRWIYERPDKHLVVIIEHDKSGRVTRTQWVDALGETWHDTDDK